MIIGPNGSGKSTFVCALCLGLGGKPEFIGRSKRVGDFVKNGCSTGRIDVFLQDTTENLVKITRVIHRETGGTLLLLLLLMAIRQNIISMTLGSMRPL